VCAFTKNCFVIFQKFETLPDEELLLGDNDNESRLEQQQRKADHQLIQLQYCLLKIFEHCGEGLLTNPELSDSIDELAYGSQRLLGHDHNWVRCNAAKLLTHILAHYDYTIVGQQLSGIKKEDGTEQTLYFIYGQPAEDIKSLVLDLCAQVVPGDTAQEMIDELSKILLYIGHMLRDVPFSLKQEKDAEDDEEREPVNKINLNWLMRNIRFLINREVAKAPHDTSIVRITIYIEVYLLNLLSNFRELPCSR